MVYYIEKSIVLHSGEKKCVEKSWCGDLCDFDNDKTGKNTKKGETNLKTRLFVGVVFMHTKI